MDPNFNPIFLTDARVRELTRIGADLLAAGATFQEMRAELRRRAGPEIYDGHVRCVAVYADCEFAWRSVRRSKTA